MIPLSEQLEQLVAISTLTSPGLPYLSKVTLFPVGGVIKGWTEALQLMPKGSKWKLYIPSDLGYGDRGAGADIPGGAALIFEVELLDIKANGHQ